MAVWFTLRVGPNPIGHFEARRIDGTGTNPDDVNTYRATLELNGQRSTVFVGHRYGDGVFGLVRRVLDAAEGLEVES